MFDSILLCCRKVLEDAKVPRRCESRRFDRTRSKPEHRKRSLAVTMIIELPMWIGDWYLIRMERCSLSTALRLAAMRARLDLGPVSIDDDLIDMSEFGWWLHWLHWMIWMIWLMIELNEFDSTTRNDTTRRRRLASLAYVDGNVEYQTYRYRIDLILERCL